MLFRSTVLKDGVLLLRISIFPKSRYAFDSMFALTIVNVTESYPYTVKELEHAILMSKSLPYFQPFRIIGGVKSFLNFPNSSTTYLESNRIIFPRDGLDLKSIKIYKNYRDGLMENYNYRIILYNYLPLNKGRNGSVFDVSAYNFNKRTKNNILKQFNVFLFMRYQDNNNLYIQYILDLNKKKFDCFFSENIPKCLYVIMNQKTKELDCYIPKNIQECLYLVKKRDDWFIPLWGFGRYNLDELDPNKNYFFTVQSMRRNLYKEKGFTALQGYDEGEFALRSFKGTVVWIVFKNGTENIVNFNTWPYDSNGNRIDTSFNNHKFPVILNEIQPTTDYFLQNLPTTLALEEKYMYFRIPVEFKDYILSFIIIKHEIYLPIISLVMIIVLLLVIFLIMSFQKMYKKIKTSRQILDK